MKKLLLFISILFFGHTIAFTQFDSSILSLKFYDQLKWRNIGPQRGGRSLGCTGTPGRPLEYYFGATGGGLWKTTDGGQTWAAVTDGQLTSSSVGAVAVAETNPDIVYIGMGETELRGSITQGDGVYKSSDGGKSWRYMGLKETQAIARVRIHPTNPDIVYVAALGHPYGENEERGVFRSTDGGNTWKKILYVDTKTGSADLIIDRQNPRIIYATTWQVYRKAWKMWGGGPGCKLWKSMDGGDTWIDLSKNPGMPSEPLGKIGITVSPADPNRLYAIVEANEGGVFRSDDGGWTWKKVNDERKLRQRAFYYSRLVADPWDKNIVYGLNVDFFKSTDGGLTFKNISTVHGDHHDLWIDPNNPQRMILADDGGGVVSTNGGKTWTEQDYITTQLYHVMATSDVPYHVAGAQQDNSTVAVASEGWRQMQAGGPGHGWYYSVGGGESGWITQHPVNKDIFYAGSQGALLTRYDRSNGQIRDIQVYPRFFSGEPSSSLPERWQWTYPIMFSPKDPKIMYTCSQHLWKTIDDGQSWEKISPDLTYADPETLGPTGGVITKDMNGPEIYATIFALAPSNHDINTIWTGSDDGKVHITRDGGKNWSDITPIELPKFSRIEIIDESKFTPGTAYLAANRYQVDDRSPYLFRTRDYGKTWTKIIQGIATGHFARAIREDAVNKNLLFLGTEHGVYFSANEGDRWQSLQSNLPNTPVRDLVIKDNDVVLGTHGRGFWIMDDIQPLRQWTKTQSENEIKLYKPADAVRSVYNAEIQYYLPAASDTVFIDILDERGNLITTFTGAKAAKKDEANEDDWYGPPVPPAPTTLSGLNKFSWNLLYPGAKVFDSIIIWGAQMTRGPKAPIGKYQVKLRVNGKSFTQPFEIKMDPNLKGVSEADIKSTFEMASRIRDKETEANEAVILIRDIKSKLASALKTTQDENLKSKSESFLKNITAIEEELYQTKNRSSQDPLNFPIKLNNRIAALRRSLETGEGKPTTGVGKVFDELSKELTVLQTKLDQVMNAEIPSINKILEEKGVKPIYLKARP